MIWWGNTTSTTHERRPHTDTSQKIIRVNRKSPSLVRHALNAPRDSSATPNPNKTPQGKNITSIQLTCGHFSLVKGKVHPKSKFLSSFSSHLVNINSKRRCLVGCSCCSFPYNESEWWPKAPMKAPTVHMACVQYFKTWKAFNSLNRRTVQILFNYLEFTCIDVPY